MTAAPTLLALDCATDVCSVALHVQGRRAQALRSVGPGHSQVVLPMLDALLAEHGVARTALEGVAFGAGPGAFTGLRVACGVAQGLGFGLDRPLLAIGNLEALAWRALTEAPTHEVVLTAVDARMGEVYAAVYGRGPTPRVLAPPSLLTPAALAPLIARHAVRLVAGNACTLHAEALTGTPAPLLRADLMADAAAILDVALLAWPLGRAVPAASAAPLYVRDRVALTTAERAAAAAA